MGFLFSGPAEQDGVSGYWCIICARIYHPTTSERLIKIQSRIPDVHWYGAAQVWQASNNNTWIRMHCKCTSTNYLQHLGDVRVSYSMRTTPATDGIRTLMSMSSTGFPAFVIRK